MAFPAQVVTQTRSTGMPNMVRIMPSMMDLRKGASPNGDRALVGFADPSPLERSLQHAGDGSLALPPSGR